MKVEETFISGSVETETWKSEAIWPPLSPEQTSPALVSTNTKPGPCLKWHSSLYTVMTDTHTLIFQSFPPKGERLRATLCKRRGKEQHPKDPWAR